MLGNSPICSFGWFTDNWAAAPAATQGTAVTPGISNAEGSWTEILSDTVVVNDVRLLSLIVIDGAVSATIKNHAIDVGIDPAGGTSYVPIISDVLCGGIDSFATGRFAEFFFPVYIPAGSAIAARVQGGAAAATTMRVVTKVYGKPSRPELIYTGAYAETIGTLSGSTEGVSFTPGTSEDGTWASLGATVKDLNHWQLSYQVSNTVVTGEHVYIELAYGDATNKHTILKTHHLGFTSEAICMALNGNGGWCYHKVPAGTNIYVRGFCAGVPDTGYNALAHGIGG